MQPGVASVQPSSLAANLPNSNSLFSPTESSGSDNSNTQNTVSVTITPLSDNEEKRSKNSDSRPSTPTTQTISRVRFARDLPTEEKLAVLMSISDPDYKITEQGERAHPDANFAEDVRLISSTDRITQVTFNLTFLLSRWNMAVDLLELINGFFPELEKIKIKEEQLLSTFSPLRQSEQKNSIEQKIVQIRKEFVTQKISDRLQEQKYSTDLKFSGEAKLTKESIGHLATVSVKLVELLFSLEGKWDRTTGNRLAPLLYAIMKELELEAENRAILWQLTNAEALNELKKSGKTIDIPKVSLWSSMLKDEDYSTYVKKFARDETFWTKLSSARNGRFNRKFPSSTSTLNPLIERAIELCINEYIKEECTFAFWLRLKRKFSMETHHGPIHAAFDRATALSKKENEASEIPFNSIVIDTKNTSPGRSPATKKHKTTKGDESGKNESKERKQENGRNNTNIESSQLALAVQALRQCGLLPEPIQQTHQHDPIFDAKPVGDEKQFHVFNSANCVWKCGYVIDCPDTFAVKAIDGLRKSIQFHATNFVKEPSTNAICTSYQKDSGYVVGFKIFVDVAKVKAADHLPCVKMQAGLLLGDLDRLEEALKLKLKSTDNPSENVLHQSKPNNS